MRYSKRGMFSAELHFEPALGQPAGESPYERLAARDAQLRHNEVLAAIAEVRAEIGKNIAPAAGAAPASMIQHLVDDLAGTVRIKAELQELAAAIETTKLEIIAVRYRDSRNVERIADVTDELDAVVGDTEAATETILGSCEKIEQQLDAATLHISSDEDRAPLEEISSQVIKIYEACNFQDISGQRITKVVNALKFIEQRIEAMIDILGGDSAFAAIEAPGADTELLEGPARPDNADAASQADIDALFN